jgi:hypothetical protein
MALFGGQQDGLGLDLERLAKGAFPFFFSL